jgi:coenzyme F420-reducing hydrogenase alpha subunit
MANRTIKVDYIARVEGESSLELHVRNGAVDAVRLSIFEPPRFFEALLRGRGFGEVLDIVARICGICPIAYQMSGVHAIEDALGLEVDPPIRALRRLFYCGEWIQSHALHIVMLHAPDFLGYPDAIAMARDHGAAVERALVLKKTGNELIRLLGGREIHPINARVGGFYRVPSRAGLAPVAEALKRARDQAIDTLRWAAGFPFPECARDYEFVALRHPDEYPMNEGRVVSSAGLDIAAADYETEFIERQVPHSTALHSVMKQHGAYLVGPMSRYALNRTVCRPRSARSPTKSGSSRSAAIHSAASSFARSKSSMPATRRCV